MDPAAGDPAPADQARLGTRALREVLEMQYQFAEPFIVDSSKITDWGCTPRRWIGLSLRLWTTTARGAWPLYDLQLR